MTGSDGTIEAHGIGGQADLPISLELAVSGAVAALVLSFTVLIVAWRSPRYDDGAHPGRSSWTPVAVVGRRWWVRAARTVVHQIVVVGNLAMRVLDVVTGHRAFAVALRVLGVVLALFTIWVSVAGKESLTNPFFGIVYVWWWVGLVFASALLGPVWRAISPVRTLSAGVARLAGSDPDTGLFTYPERLGHWPAALGLYAFVWLELAYEYPTELGSVRLWCALYLAAMLVGGALFGNRFFERADPFEVYSSLIAKLAPWARVDGRLVVRSPLSGLSTIEPRPGLVAVVAVLFGSTAFDSFRESTFWVKTYQESSISKVWLDNGALLTFCVTAGVVFAVACALTPSADVPRRHLPRQFAHSIVPIILGYILAHYLTLFIDVGTQTLARASDPLGKGWDVLGTASVEPSYWFSYHPSVLASIKVLAVVLGHIAAAMAAHDRALALLPRRHQVTGQLPLLVAMVGFTAGGLFLLFNA